MRNCPKNDDSLDAVLAARSGLRKIAVTYRWNVLNHGLRRFHAKRAVADFAANKHRRELGVGTAKQILACYQADAEAAVRPAAGPSVFELDPDKWDT